MWVRDGNSLKEFSDEICLCMKNESFLDFCGIAHSLFVTFVEKSLKAQNN